MNAFPSQDQLRQRSDYTYKFNANIGRHGWFRLTPAYSVKIVEELLDDHADARRIFDPFCGTGTTALCAAYRNREATTIDINPFLVWLTKAKVAHYSPSIIQETRYACVRVIEQIADGAVEPAPPPPISNVRRWWGTEALEFLCRLRAIIDHVTQPDAEARNLLLIAFCRTVIQQSHAAFHHPSLSFDNNKRLDFFSLADRTAAFKANVEFVLNSAAENPPISASVVLADSREFGKLISGPFDLVITSPPYANRISYIRELRPYMYWLGFLKTSKDAGELDWMAIGGTWGVATSRLVHWERPDNGFHSTRLKEVLYTIAHAGKKNGPLLANYIAKYLDDMWSHFCNLRKLLAPGARLHYIVGNSTFYNTLVATEQIYAEMLSELGFSQVECRPIRKRNSKKELIEFDVTARWQ